MLKTTPNRLSILLAASLHLILFILLFWHFSSPSMHQIPLQPDVDIIKAVAVNPSQLKQQHAALHAEEDRQRHEQAEKQRLKEEMVQKQQQAEKLQQQKAQELAAKEAQQKAAEEAALLAKQQAEQQKVQAQKQKTVEKQQSAQKAEQALSDLAKQAAQEKTAQKHQADKKRQEAAQKLKLAQQKDLDKQMAAEQKQLAAARTKDQQSEIDKYKALIEQSISQHWVVPTASNPDLSCDLLIKVGPGGVVLSVSIAHSSGDTALDNSARTAVFKASPLPVPANKELFEQFRELRLKVKPENIAAAV